MGEGPDVKTEREKLPSLRRNNVGKGDWTAANADIYAELEPVLMIASRILMSIHLVPWVRSSSSLFIPFYRVSPLTRLV